MDMSMREKLEHWRKEKGRTAMKRLSYVMPYCEQGGKKTSTLKQPPEQQQTLKPKNSVTPHTIRTGIHHTSHFKTLADSQKVTHQRFRKSVCNPMQSYEKPIDNEAQIPLPLRIDSSNELREALEAWQAANGRSLKRTRSVLPSSSRVARKRRHTMQVFPPMEQCKDSQYHDDRQADCASVVSCSQANAPGNDDGTVVQRLDFDGAGHDQQQLDEIGSLANRLDHTPPTRRRRTCVHFVDDTVVFGSTAIKYSRLRSDRRRTVATPNEPSGTIFVTPVRRSTRKNKSTLGVELDKAVCFDSPSDLCTVDDTCIVKVVPNLALLFDNS